MVVKQCFSQPALQYFINVGHKLVVLLMLFTVIRNAHVSFNIGKCKLLLLESVFPGSILLNKQFFTDYLPCIIYSRIYGSCSIIFSYKGP